MSLLSRPTHIVERPLFRGTAAAALLLILCGLCAGRGSAPATAVVTLAISVGMAAALLVSRSQLISPISVSAGPDCFLVDSTHLPAVGHFAAKVNPTTLETNLLRCGLRVAHLDDWDEDDISKARGIAFIAPRRPFSRAEIDDLLNFEEAGGVVLLAVGHPDSPPSRPLLLAHDLDLEARPLGTVPTRSVSAADSRGRERERPRFLDAWPVISASAKSLTAERDVTVLFRVGDDITALFRRQGRGGLLLFSDSRFFSTMNVEDVGGHWLGNLALIHDVFRKYLGVEPDKVRPLFRSPTKPQ